MKQISWRSTRHGVIQTKQIAFRVTQFISLITLMTASSAPAGETGVPSTRPTTRPKLPERHVIEGIVQNANGRGIQAMVFILDAETGLPYSNVTDHPFTESAEFGTHVPSGTDGRFTIPGVFPGPYRFVAQSWNDNPPPKTLREAKGDTTTLCGIAENVNVTEDQKPPYLILKPVGTAAVHVTFKRSDTFILVSTHALAGDVILQFLALRGDFLRNLVGTIEMRHKFATMYGLPAGPLYFYAFVNGDGGPQEFGACSVVAKAGEMVDAAIPLISPLNGEMKLPDAVANLEAMRKEDPHAFQAAILAATPKEMRERAKKGDEIDLPLDLKLSLPGGKSFTWGDYLALREYQQFNQQARELAKAAGK